MRSVIVTVLAALIPAGWAVALTTTTTSYQQNINGYVDGAQMRISTTATRDGTDGNTSSNYLIDGYAPDNLTTPAFDPSPDEQDLIRFTNIFGAGQIPLGATILDAQLTYRTSGTSTANSPGPWGVAALLQPFTSDTRYGDFPSPAGADLTPPQAGRGAWFEDGVDQIGHPYATRPVGGFAGIAASGGNPATGTQALDTLVSAEISPLVQRWSDDPTGTNNYGFVVQAGWTGVSNGWGFYTNGNNNTTNRPSLAVTYTTDPIGKYTFQRGLNDYSSDTVVRLSSGADLVESSDDITIDGSMETGAFYIDESESSAATHLRGLMKFSNVFGSNTGQAPADKPVAKAWLVLTTGTNDDNRSPGPFTVSKMLRDWDTTTLYSSFGAVPGLQEADDDISPALDTNMGMTNGSESWFDVTSYLEGVRSNPLAPDYGLAIGTLTNDGWAIFLNGATDVSVHPRLVVYSDLSTAPAGILGDYDDNGTVDSADYVLWRNGGPLQNESDAPGTVNSADYTYWRSRFGATSGSGSELAQGSVPEPTTWVLGLIATLAISVTSSRNR